MNITSRITRVAFTLLILVVFAGCSDGTGPSISAGPSGTFPLRTVDDRPVPATWTQTVGNQTVSFSILVGTITFRADNTFEVSETWRHDNEAPVTLTIAGLFAFDAGTRALTLTYHDLGHTERLSGTYNAGTVTILDHDGRWRTFRK